MTISELKEITKRSGRVCFISAKWRDCFTYSENPAVILDLIERFEKMREALGEGFTIVAEYVPGHNVWIDDTEKLLSEIDAPLGQEGK